jgi:hypothetical protein
MSGGESALDLVAKRLERAVVLLEQRLADKLKQAKAGADGVDRAGLEAELEAARTREKQLEAAGAEASAALGRAISEIRTALNGHAKES